MKEKVSLISLFTSFAKVGVMTFGGGMAMLPLLIREVSENKKWATEEELSDYYAIAQCTPGIIAVNTATFVGTKNRGIIGGIIATLGIVFPSVIIITALAGVISLFAENIIVQKAFIGIRITVCVLVLNSVIKLSKSAIKGKVTIITFLVSAALILILNFSPIIIVLLALMTGLISSRFQATKKEVGND